MYKTVKYYVNQIQTQPASAKAPAAALITHTSLFLQWSGVLQRRLLPPVLFRHTRICWSLFTWVTIICFPQLYEQRLGLTFSVQQVYAPKPVDRQVRASNFSINSKKLFMSLCSLFATLSLFSTLSVIPVLFFCPSSCFFFSLSFSIL